LKAWSWEVQQLEEVSMGFGFDQLFRNKFNIFLVPLFLFFGFEALSHFRSRAASAHFSRKICEIVIR